MKKLDLRWTFLGYTPHRLDEVESLRYEFWVNAARRERERMNSLSITVDDTTTIVDYGNCEDIAAVTAAELNELINAQTTLKPDDV